MRYRTVFALLALISLLPNALAQSPGRALASHTVIQQTSDELLEAIDGRREILEANPFELHAIVDEVLRTRFDTVYAARLILPRHWATITPEQRQKFVEALYSSLVRRYSFGLLKHSETRVRVTPLRLKPVSPSGEDFVTVKTLVTLDDGTEVPVNYEMRWFEHTWKVYDVNIESRSYVLYYRSVFGQEIEAKGIDKIIEDLNAS
jgi:ABC-type transporter MlaC component